MAVEDGSQLSGPDVLQRMFSKKRKKRKNIVIISDSEGEDEAEKTFEGSQATEITTQQ